MPHADYIMVGGFLGAGKTTAMLRLAEHLTAGGRRVGLITNDQSSGLVDTTLVEAHGYAVQEITGGCFCCRFNSLTAAAEQLTTDAAPDVFLAEPVGSCTDLRASVQYPLRRLYGDHYRVAPLSVLVDPIRALRVLGLEPGRAFSPKVRYVYGKQLEEADIIAINKSDLLDEARRILLEDALRTTYPHADVLTMSARARHGLESWFARLSGAETHTRPAPDVDYDVYADGEALLGWCNATFQLEGDAPVDGNALLLDLAREITALVSSERPEIAHLKMTLTPDEEMGDLALLNLVGSDRAPELSHRLHEALDSGELIVNVRAEGAPELLRSAVTQAVDRVAAARGLQAGTVHIEHFRSARPTPTHRIGVV